MTNTETVNLDSLKDFISGIKLPADAPTLTKTARQRSADRSVVQFFASLDPFVSFKGADEVLERAEEVNILRAQRHEVPPNEAIEWEED